VLAHAELIQILIKRYLEQPKPQLLTILGLVLKCASLGEATIRQAVEKVITSFYENRVDGMDLLASGRVLSVLALLIFRSSMTIKLMAVASPRTPCTSMVSMIWLYRPGEAILTGLLERATPLRSGYTLNRSNSARKSD
jgi:hypothetical protein